MTDVGAGVGAGGAEPARVDFRCDDPEVDPYRLLTATVVPRPIAWVGTVGADGAGNLAPHSFYSVACAKPPIVSFTSVGHKDTLRNVRATGEFVVNLATADLVRAVNDTSAPFDPEVDEAGATGLTLVPSTTVSVPRVARSPSRSSARCTPCTSWATRCWCSATSAWCRSTRRRSSTATRRWPPCGRCPGWGATSGGGRRRSSTSPARAAPRTPAPTPRVRRPGVGAPRRGGRLVTGTHRSLTREEAAARADLLRVETYRLQWDLTRGDEVFGATTSVRFRSGTGRTFLDVRAVEVAAATLDGAALDPGTVVDGRLPLDLAEGEHELRLAATMAYRHDGEGLHRAVDPADAAAYVYLMCFMDAAPTAWACFDQPDLKARVEVEVLAPDDWTVLGNGAATALGEGRWRLAPTEPLSTYLVTLAAGPWHVLRAEHDGIGLGLSARRSLAADLDREADELFTLTRQSFDELHRLFGIRYRSGSTTRPSSRSSTPGPWRTPAACCSATRWSSPAGSRATPASAVRRPSPTRWPTSGSATS